MTINDLRQETPKIKNIVTINREFEYKNQIYTFAFLGKKEEGNKLTAWILGQNIYNNIKYTKSSNKTNRQRFNMRFKDIDLPLMNLSEIKIGNLTLDVESGSTKTPCFNSFRDKENYIMNYVTNYIFMILNKCNLGQLENNDLADLCIYEYTFSNNIEISNINQNNAITLCFKHRHKTIKVNKTLNLKMGEYGGKKYSIRNKLTKEKQFIYIDRLVHYDIWKEAETHFNNPKYKKIATDEQISHMKQQYLESLPSICPKSMDLAVLEYETEKETNLGIYTKEFLNEKPKSNSGSSMLLLLHSDSKPLKGHKVRSCIIEPIEKNFNGIINLEIFDAIENLPDEEIEI